MPKVPPAPILRVEESVPAKVNVLDNVKVLDVVEPPAIENPVVAGVREIPFTEVTPGRVVTAVEPKDIVVEPIVNFAFAIFLAIVIMASRF